VGLPAGGEPQIAGAGDIVEPIEPALLAAGEEHAEFVSGVHVNLRPALPRPHVAAHQHRRGGTQAEVVETGLSRYLWRCSPGGPGATHVDDYTGSPAAFPLTGGDGGGYRAKDWPPAGGAGRSRRPVIGSVSGENRACERGMPIAVVACRAFESRRAYRSSPASSRAPFGCTPARPPEDPNRQPTECFSGP
jgi:hypothetical protein